MKSLLRFAAITIASTALIASGAATATAAPAASTLAAPAPVSASGTVDTAAAPYRIHNSFGVRYIKRGKKITFKLKARYVDDAGNVIGIRRAKIEILKGGKWKTAKNVKLKSNGTGTYKRTDKKRHKYRMTVKATSLYQGARTFTFKV
jgi:hypothetical protein